MSELIHRLKQAFGVSNYKDLSQKLEVKEGTIKTWVNRDSYDLKGIVSKCNPEIDLNWLLTGKGEMLKAAISAPVRSTSNLIPFYDGVAIGGTGEVANLDAQTQTAERVDAGDWFRDATSAMRVHGDSMHPLYKSGSIVALKKVNDKSLIVYGQDYVLETSEYRIIKRLQRSAHKACWLCCSVNEDTYANTTRLIHEPFDVPIDSVTTIHRVLGNVFRTESSRIIIGNEN